MAADHVEGGLYVSPEFQLGQVYDGTIEQSDDIILYRPVYGCVPHEKVTVTNTNNATGGGRHHHGATSSSTHHDKASSNEHLLLDDDHDFASEKMTSV